jgi:16S rRNA (uracil1498-N3)-methyltransferase
MRLTRIYTPQALQIGRELTLEPMPSAHLIRVLRLRAGAVVALFNGDGEEYLASITIPKVEAVQVQVQSMQKAAAESPLKIWLLQGLCRGEKMDLVLEKATELGVHGIIPVNTERTEVNLEPERAAKRLEHWQRVVVSACEQSGRALVPLVWPLLDLDKRLTQALPCSHGFALEPGSAPLAHQFQKGAEAILLAVGPEGGFSERDLTQLRLVGFTGASLGPRVLRTETAGLAAISTLQVLGGDF